MSFFLITILNDVNRSPKFATLKQNFYIALHDTRKVYPIPVLLPHNVQLNQLQWNLNFSN